MVCSRAEKRYPWSGILRTASLGRRHSRNDMTIVHSAALRKWARRSLLIAALVAAPAAYSEVVSQPPEDPGTLLGNYLSGRMARGDHDTIAAADFYSKALGRGSRQRDHSRADLPARGGLGPLGSRHPARPGSRQDRAGSQDRPIPPRLRGLQARQLQGGRRAFRRGAPGTDRRSHLDPRPRLGAGGRRQARRGLRHPRQLERCRLGPVLSALSPCAHRRHRRQARRGAPGLRPGLQEESDRRSGWPTPTRAMR